jgi:hypothetical protein
MTIDLKNPSLIYVDKDGEPHNLLPLDTDGPTECKLGEVGRQSAEGIDFEIPSLDSERIGSLGTLRSCRAWRPKRQSGEGPRTQY